MARTLNGAQAKLLANFSADVAKGLVFLDVAVPIFSKEILGYRILLVLICTAMIINLLNFSLELLKGVKE